MAGELTNAERELLEEWRRETDAETRERALRAAVWPVVRAVLYKGREPDYHERQLRECRRRMPLLFAAVDHLITTYLGEVPT